MSTISICIPTYEMKDLGVTFLEESFKVLTQQTFKDFDIIISDHSQNTAIEDLCKTYADKLDVHYYRNPENRGSSSANINNAIKKATGKLIKILFQDDFLYHEKSLEDIVNNFDVEKNQWLVTASIHTKDGNLLFKPFYPRYNNHIHLGNNTISSPSVLTIKNDSPLLFNENLIWLMDVEYYKRYYDAFGMPKILNSINVVNRTGSHQVSRNIANRQLRKKEYYVMLKQYERGFNFWYYRIIGYMKDLIKHMLGKI